MEGKNAVVDKRPDDAAVGYLPPRSSPVALTDLATSPPTVDGFQITAPLGSGGMGTVWRAWQLSAQREVALKLLHFSAVQSEQAKKRFEREIQLTARLEHPNIARLYDSGINHGVYFYAMELIEGVPLDEYVRENKLTGRQIVELLRVACMAVQHAHCRGVIHRDLKPSNILVDKAGNPHILDFGLAKTFEVNPHSAVSFVGELAGTPQFMSPEQAAGKTDQLDGRSDVYSLGIILYYLLTNRFPFNATNSRESFLQSVVAGEFIAPRKAAPRIEVDLDTLLSKALAKSPGERYQTAAALGADLQNYLLSEPLQARPPSNWYYVKKKAFKHRTMLKSCAAAIVLLAIPFTYNSIQLGKERQKGVALEAKQAKLEKDRIIQDAERLLNHAKNLLREKKWIEARQKFELAAHIQQSHGIAPADAALGLIECERSAPLPVLSFQVGRAPLLAASFAAEDHKIWIASTDGSIRCRDLLTREETPLFRELTSVLSSIRFVQKQNSAVTAWTQAGDGVGPVQVRTIDLKTGRMQSSYDLVRRPASVFFSEDGRYTAAISAHLDEDSGNTVDLYDNSSGRLLFSVPKGRSDYFTTTISSDSSTLLVGDSHGRVEWWDVASGNKVRTVESGRERVNSIIASTDASSVYGACTIGTVRITRDPAAIQPVVRDKPEWTQALTFDSHDHRFMTTDRSGRILSRDVASGEIIQEFDCWKTPVSGCETSSDGKLLLGYSTDGFVAIWPKRMPDRRLSPLYGIRQFASSSDNRYFGVGDLGASFYLYDSVTGKRLLYSQQPSDLMGDVRFSSDSRRLFVANRMGYAYEWNLASNELVSLFAPIKPLRFWYLQFAPGRQAVVGVNARGAWIRRAPDWEPINRFDDGLVQIGGVTPDEKFAFTYDANGSVTGLDLNNGKSWKMPSIGPNNIQAGAIFPNGQDVLLGTNEGNVISVNYVTGQKNWTVPVHGNRIRSLAISLDGSLILSAGEDGFVKLLDSRAGQELCTVTTSISPAFDAQFSRDQTAIHVLAESGKDLVTLDLKRALDANASMHRASNAWLTLEKIPLDADANAAVAEWLLSRGQEGWAKLILERFSNRDPQSSSRLARIYWIRGEFKSAESEYDRLVKLALDEDSRTYYELCRNAVVAESKERRQ